MARQLYEMQEWENLPSENTPISGARLEHIEQGIYDNSDKMALKEIYGDNSLSMGRKAESDKGVNSLAFGALTTASGDNSQSFGYNTVASGDFGSHAEGTGTTASGQASHAEGSESKSTEIGSHSEGLGTTASSQGSHAEGMGTIASGQASHAEGLGTKANSQYQHVQGKYNVEDIDNQYANIVGGGTSNDDRKNIYTLDWQGNAIYAGDVTNGNGVSLDGLKASIDYILSIIQPEEGGEAT